MSFLCPVRRAAEATPSAPALSFGGQRWTYAQLDREVSAWAAELDRRGVQAGDRVAVLSPNRPEFVFLIHALPRLRATLVPLNARLTEAELAPLIARVSPALLVVDASLEARVTAAAVSTVLFAEGRSPASRTDPSAPLLLHPDDVRCILFTSGTTGVPKGAELTVANFAANAAASAGNLGGEPDQIWLGCLPLFHVGGIALIARAAAYGAPVVLQPGFDPEQALAAIRDEGVTHASLVPTGLRRLMALTSSFPSTLRAVLIGGGPVSRDVIADARGAGIPALETYGLTEACSQVATMPMGSSERGMVPIDGVQLRISDSGEIQLRGPTVMRGYFEDPAATARAFDDGWLRTGDLGELNAQGELTVHARRTDLIISGGENVYPAEVEGVLAAHPAVADVAVTGVDHPEWGQQVVAVVALRAAVEDSELTAHCRGRLAGYKLPRKFVRVDALPRNANGKVDRIALRNLAQKFR